jgi:hypothetical protein
MGARAATGVSVEEMEEAVGAVALGSLAGADVPALFSAVMEVETIGFTIGGCKQESTVSLRPMNADLMARYRDNVTKFSTQEDGSESPKFIFEPNTAEADVALLLGTVTDFSLFYIKPDKNGEVTEQVKFPKDIRRREAMFRDMHPALRSLLIQECKRVNGLNPLSQE